MGVTLREDGQGSLETRGQGMMDHPKMPGWYRLKGELRLIYVENGRLMVEDLFQPLTLEEFNSLKTPR